MPLVLLSVQRHRGLERRRELLHRGSRGRARDRRLLVPSSCCLFPPEQDGNLHRKRRPPLLARLDVPDLEAHLLELGTGEEGAAGQRGADFFFEPLAERAVPLRVQDEGKGGRRGGRKGGRGRGRGGLGVNSAAAAPVGFSPTCCRWREAGRGASRSRGRRGRGGRGRGAGDNDKQLLISPPASSIASSDKLNDSRRREGCCIDGGPERAATSASCRERRALGQEAAGRSHCVLDKSEDSKECLVNVSLCFRFTKSTFASLLAHFLSCFLAPTLDRQEKPPLYFFSRL